MAKEYLDKDGVLYFWQKIKALFLTDVSYNSTSKKIQKTKNGTTSDVVTLSTVATSGSYNDLSNKPTIPSGVEKSTTTPLMNGTASVGSETKFAAGDHVHPSDTTKVDKVTGKGLSTEDYTTAEKTKLAEIAEGANAYVHPSYTARTGKPTSNQTPSFGNTFTISQITSDATGHVTGATDRTVKIPNATATQSAAGLMSSADKTKVDKLVFDGNYIDESILPSYVDDVIEAYARSGQTALSSTWLATGSASGTVITPETGKIYVLMADSGDYAANTQFRWGGTAYVKLADGGVSSISNAEIDTIVAS